MATTNLHVLYVQDVSMNVINSKQRLRHGKSLSSQFLPSPTGSYKSSVSSRSLFDRKLSTKLFKSKSLTVSANLHDNSSVSNFKENDEAYAGASVLESTEVRSTREGFVVKMTDGRQMACKHAATQTTQLHDSGPQPAIVLRLEDGSGIMLPIIVLDQPAQLLKECMRNVPLSRPTVYQVMKDMVKYMGYELKLVRITHRVCEAYYARAYLCRVGEGWESMVSLDMRPSDAINFAARSKVPIQVNKSLAEGDGVIPLTVTPKPTFAKYSRASFLSNADLPADGSDIDAQEFALVRAITISAMLERYTEAARYRDELRQFRAIRGRLSRNPYMKASDGQKQDQV